MKPSRLGIVIGGIGLALAGGCSERARGPDGGARVAISVAPLELDGVRGARYRIEVVGVEGEPVWSEVLTSDRHGDGRGGLAYVGPCDASASPNRVRLTLEELLDDEGEAIDEDTWRNPTPVVREVPCEPNRDSEVAFDLVIARDAGQGFVDVGVTFADVHCSAKVDCVDALLHHGAARDTTVVVAFACTSGAEDPTWLHMSAIEVTCDGTTHALVPLGDPGNQGASAPHLFQWASYRGQERLAPYDKCYWNTAIGLDLDAITGDCTLTATATATDVPLVGGVTDPAQVYPFLRWELNLVEDGALACGSHALDQGAAVSTRYTREAPEPFDFSMACADAPDVTTPGVDCAGDGLVVLAPTPDGVRVSPSGGTPVSYALPSGYTFAGCCADPCCQPED